MAKAKAKNEAAPKAKKPAAPKANMAAEAKKSVAKSTSGAAPQIVTTVTQNDIAKVAYAIWERKGRPAGQDAANWAEAERELKVR